ncbi:ABC transporter permease [Salinibacterium sp. M195]|uniref:ABC transporter permease n=1 Tax=Salinibacterium sp. M195 TaxID=2583374 RepID=UPI001C633CFF|nr:ABC transporter permease [Salinibacterium sp. M195]QYH34990.1 ABC transporter permease [Salinibacterium sp. M195]
MAKRQNRAGGRLKWLPATITFLIAAVLWQVTALANPFVIPTLDQIGLSLVTDADTYWRNSLVTGLEVVIGASAGILLGFLVAIIMAEFRLMERAVMPLVVVVMVTPIVALAPALVVAFGFGIMPKFVVTALVVFFPMLINSLAGLRDVDDQALDVMKTLHASRWEIFRDLRFTGSLPYVFAGLRIALPLAVVGASVAEFVAAGQQAGLGSLVTIAAAQANLPVTWASITLLCVMGVILISTLAFVRTRVLWWNDGAAKDL